MGVLAAVAIASALPASASAGIRGPCSATIKGRSVADLTLSTADAIPVRLGSRVVVTMAAHQHMTHYRITLTFAGATRTIKDKDISSSSWADSVRVRQYAQLGRGFYVVRGESTGPGLSCSGEALVHVT